MSDTLGATAFVIAGLLWIRTGYSPLALAIRCLLHLQAIVACAGIALRAAGRAARERYWSCYEAARRKAGE